MIFYLRLVCFISLIIKCEEIILSFLGCGRLVGNASSHTLLCESPNLGQSSHKIATKAAELGGHCT